MSFSPKPGKKRDLAAQSQATYQSAMKRFTSYQPEDGVLRIVLYAKGWIKLAVWCIRVGRNVECVCR